MSTCKIVDVYRNGFRAGVAWWNQARKEWLWMSFTAELNAYGHEFYLDGDPDAGAVTAYVIPECEGEYTFSQLSDKDIVFNDEDAVDLVELG